MASVGTQEAKINEIRQQTGSTPLALTESHFTIRGRNRGDLNSTWAVGVAYARFQNLYQRHGDVLRIANIGDFCGNRRSEEHTSELQSLMRNSYAVFRLKKKKELSRQTTIEHDD